MKNIQEIDIEEGNDKGDSSVDHSATTLQAPSTLKMVIHCKKCGKPFDSTFSVEEFSGLSEQQYKSGTLHLCPQCGTIAIYTLNDYREPDTVG